MTQSRGPNRAKYQKKYNANPDEIDRINAQKRARYAYEKKHGKLPDGIDVHHKKPARDGGSFDESNLVAVTEKAHRGWNRKKKK